MFKYIIIFLLIIGTSLYTNAQRITRAEYIDNYKDIAISEMQRTGIPASIKLAQASLESDNGNSYLAQKAKNHFGIKCHSSWTGGKVYKDDDAKGECFRKYRRDKDSWIDHSDFLTSGRRYAFLFDLPSDDYKAWAKGLKDAGYATNPKYPELLIRIIEDNKLYLFDKPHSIQKAEKQKEQKEQKSKTRSNIDPDKHEISIGGREILENNRAKYIIAKEGDSYEKLTNEFNKLSWELYRFNDVERGSKLEKGEIVYIQPKKFKAERRNNTHIVKSNETLHSISQLYGVKIKSLAKRNNISENDKINEGDTLYLRKRKPLK